MGLEEEALKAAAQTIEATQRSEEEKKKAAEVERAAQLNKSTPDYQFVAEIFDELRPLERNEAKETRQGTDMAIEECISQIRTKYPSLVDKIKHVGGGSTDRKDLEDQKEVYFKNIDAGKGESSNLNSSYADGTLHDTRKDLRAPGATFNFNGMTTLADGITPTNREAEQLKKLIKNAAGHVVRGIGKIGRKTKKEDFMKQIKKR